MPFSTAESLYSVVKYPGYFSHYIIMKFVPEAGISDKGQ